MVIKGCTWSAATFRKSMWCSNDYWIVLRVHAVPRKHCSHHYTTNTSLDWLDLLSHAVDAKFWSDHLRASADTQSQTTLCFPSLQLFSWDSPVKTWAHKLFVQQIIVTHGHVLLAGDSSSIVTGAEGEALSKKEVEVDGWETLPWGLRCDSHTELSLNFDPWVFKGELRKFSHLFTVLFLAKKH